MQHCWTFLNPVNSKQEHSRKLQICQDNKTSASGLHLLFQLWTTFLWMFIITRIPVWMLTADSAAYSSSSSSSNHNPGANFIRHLCKTDACLLYHTLWFTIGLSTVSLMQLNPWSYFTFWPTRLCRNSSRQFIVRWKCNLVGYPWSYSNNPQASPDISLKVRHCTWSNATLEVWLWSLSSNKGRLPLPDISAAIRDNWHQRDFLSTRQPWCMIPK